MGYTAKHADNAIRSRQNETKEPERDSGKASLSGSFFLRGEDLLIHKPFPDSIQEKVYDEKDHIICTCFVRAEAAFGWDLFLSPTGPLRNCQATGFSRSGAVRIPFSARQNRQSRSLFGRKPAGFRCTVSTRFIFFLLFQELAKPVSSWCKTEDMVGVGFPRLTAALFLRFIQSNYCDQAWISLAAASIN